MSGSKDSKKCLFTIIQTTALIMFMRENCLKLESATIEQQVPHEIMVLRNVENSQE